MLGFMVVAKIKGWTFQEVADVTAANAARYLASGTGSTSKPADSMTAANTTSPNELSAASAE